MDHLASAAAACQAAAAQFIFTELRTAMAFCELALTTRDVVFAERNARHAERALGAAWHVQRGVQLSSVELEQFVLMTVRLSSLLDQIQNRMLPCDPSVPLLPSGE